jgi:peptidoglycan/LPS O-acetylase OafA/YrhL
MFKAIKEFFTGKPSAPAPAPEVPYKMEAAVEVAPVVAVAEVSTPAIEAPAKKVRKPRAPKAETAKKTTAKKSKKI